MLATAARDFRASRMKSESKGFLHNKDIVIVTLSEWDGPRRIRHHLAHEFAKQGNRVLFIEGFYTLSKFIKKPDFSKFFRFLRGPREIGKNLFLLSVIPFLPFGEFSAFVSRLNWSVARVFMKRAMKKLGFRGSVLIIFAYNADSIVGRFDEEISVYFCNDAFDKLYTRESLRRKIAALEQRLIKKVDAVITVSEKLTEEKSPFAKKITTIHHGVDYQLFEDVLRSGAIPAEFAKMQRPVIGYSGVIRHIIDLDLLDYAAAQRPNWSIVIVGPVTESGKRYYEKVEELKKRKNVYFLGSKPSDDVPRYINQFDVCVLPYTLEEVSTYYAAPLKFYEYLAAGKPVVSTVGPRDLEEFIVLNATTKENFVEAIGRASTMMFVEYVAKRKEVARRNSWQERVNAIAEFLSTI